VSYRIIKEYQGSTVKSSIMIFDIIIFENLYILYHHPQHVSSANNLATYSPSPFLATAAISFLGLR